ncbi:AraC family transcriptional regulator [Paenibacillus sp. PL2-23]|uniref:helix-turn-helix domain-containing protein n=1 Tax=Paenibacillus sp. PL2-23 TaxID=2100729 RepID=UPI0030FA82F9
MQSDNTPVIKKLIHHSPSELAKQLPCYVNAMGWRVYGADMANERKTGEFYDFQIQYVLKGKGYLLWNDTVYSLQQGDFFFINLSIGHKYYADPIEPWEAVWIHFGGSQATLYYHLFGQSRPVVTFPHHDIAGELMLQLLEQYDRLSSEFDLLAGAHLIRIMTELTIASTSKLKLTISNEYRSEVQRAIRFIEEHIQESLTVEMVSRYVKFSPFHFSRLFKRITGFSVLEYITKYRISRVKELMIQTDLSLAEIAGRTGYCDQSHLGKMFKRMEGITPNQFRKNARFR